jgi:hypothetical protein
VCSSRRPQNIDINALVIDRPRNPREESELVADGADRRRADRPYDDACATSADELAAGQLNR